MQPETLDSTHQGKEQWVTCSISKLLAFSQGSSLVLPSTEGPKVPIPYSDLHFPSSNPNPPFCFLFCFVLLCSGHNENKFIAQRTGATAQRQHCRLRANEHYNWFSGIVWLTGEIIWTLSVQQTQHVDIREMVLSTDAMAAILKYVQQSRFMMKENHNLRWTSSPTKQCARKKRWCMNFIKLVATFLLSLVRWMHGFHVNLYWVAIHEKNKTTNHVVLKIFICKFYNLEFFLWIISNLAITRVDILYWQGQYDEDLSSNSLLDFSSPVNYVHIVHDHHFDVIDMAIVAHSVPALSGISRSTFEIWTG